jgi:signal transduction histidine kinase
LGNFEEKLFQGLKVIPLGILLFDEEGKPVYSNGVLNSFSPTKESLERLVTSTIDEILKFFLISSENSLVFEKEINKKIIVEITLNKIILAPETKPSVLAIVRNITEYKKTDMLKSDFLALIAHELKTPLTAITGPVALLLSKAAGVINENQAKFLFVIKKNAERLARLLNNLSDLAGIESGKVTLKKSRASILEVIKNALLEVSMLLKEKNIRVKENLPQLLPEANLDQLKVERVLVNLLVNAIKFSSEDSEITLAVKVKTDPSGNFLEVSVIDEGVGIKPAYLEKIFEKFYQVETAQKNQGTGLGLAVAKYIVEAHGGKIWAESPVIPPTLTQSTGRGSKFNFTLPL